MCLQPPLKNKTKQNFFSQPEYLLYLPLVWEWAKNNMWPGGVSVYVVTSQRGCGLSTHTPLEKGRGEGCGGSHTVILNGGTHETVLHNGQRFCRTQVSKKEILLNSEVVLLSRNRTHSLL